MSEVTATPVAKSDSNLMAAISYLWILSIVMYFVKKDDEFVRFHAKQGMVLFIAELVCTIIPVINFFAWIVFLIIAIVAASKAYKGERWVMPVVGGIAEKINF
ncbi:MAG: DUF4870 domain-containing protein [candidate division WWE3 bacterium]|nr:DUF4870 domain-containing protein [candidate division WWE3 bacterium]